MIVNCVILHNANVKNPLILKTNQYTILPHLFPGGYDDRVQENKDYYLELRSLAEKYKLQDNVTFLQSFSDTQKVALLQLCNCLLYTPSHEHFGIVPIEAMYMRRPVIAVSSGGPLETVLHNETGFLCSS